jgi:hypothetical protein
MQPFSLIHCIEYANKGTVAYVRRNDPPEIYADRKLQVRQ